MEPVTVLAVDESDAEVDLETVEEVDAVTLLEGCEATPEVDATVVAEWAPVVRRTKVPTPATATIITMVTTTSATAMPRWSLRIAGIRP